MSVNKVMLLGRLGQDPELRYTSSGQGVTNFSLATNESWTDKAGQKQEKTEWHRVVVWGKTAELCNQYLSKGREVFLEGSLQTRSWEKDGQKRYTTEIVARNVKFLGGRQNINQTDVQAPGPQGNEEVMGNGTGTENGFSAEDIPF